MRYVLEHSDEAERLEYQAKIPQYSIANETNKLQIKAGSKVLDAGCGTGVLTRYIHDQFPGIKIEGFDYSPVRIEEAKKRIANSSYNIHFFQDNIQKMSKDSASYDVIISRYVIEHLSSPKLAIKEMVRLLRPGGMLYIIDFDGIYINLHSSNERFNFLLEKIKSGFNSDFYVGRKLPSYFQEAGLVDIDFDISAVQFKGNDAELEYINNKQRGINCYDEFSRILGSKELAIEFNQLYLEESIKPGNVLFYNKFIVKGLKK